MLEAFGKQAKINNGLGLKTSRLHFLLVPFSRPKSLRNQLVFWNVLVLLLMLTVVSIIEYVLFTQRVITDVDEQLRIQASELETSTRVWQVSGQSFNADFYNHLVRGAPVDEFSAEPVYIKLLDTQTGKTISRSPGLEQEHLTVNQRDFDTARQGRRTFSTERNDWGRQVRVLMLPLYDQNQQLLAIAQLSQSMQKAEQINIVLVTVLTLRTVIAAIIVYGAGYWLTSRQLRPLGKFVRTMHDLSEKNLQTRLPEQKATVEVELLTQAFNQMVERLEASFALQRAFVSDVSHELRTPLTTIRGQLEVMLLDPALNHDSQQDIQQVKAELERLSRLVINLLANARAGVGMLPQLHPVSTNNVELDTLLVETARQARHLKPEVPVQIGQIEQISLPGDNDLLKQLLLNLVDNAVTHSPAGSCVRLELSRVAVTGSAGLETTLVTNHWAVLAVADSGPGIVAEDLPHIFERHYRASQTKSNSKFGAGLGLYIARLIAEAHGGHITVESESGKGSCFKVWLPLVEQPAPSRLLA